MKYFLTVMGTSTWTYERKRYRADDSPYEIERGTALAAVGTGYVWLAVTVDEPAAVVVPDMTGVLTMADIKHGTPAPYVVPPVQEEQTDGAPADDGEPSRYCDEHQKQYATDASYDRHMSSQHPQDAPHDSGDEAQQRPDVSTGDGG